MIQRSCRTSPFGFTLMEILIAVVIFAIVMTVLFSTFKSFVVSGQAVKNEIEWAQKVRTSLSVITRDLQSVFIMQPPRYRKPSFNASPDPYMFYAEPAMVSGVEFSRLMFASLGHISFGEPVEKGPARIIYYVRLNREQGFDLCRSDSVRPFPDFDDVTCDPVLFRNITGFEISFADQDRDMHTYWNSDSAEFDYTFPLSVTIKIKSNYEGKQMVEITEISLPAEREAIE